MLEGSTAVYNWRLLNHKKHLIIFTIYGFLSRTFDTPYSSITFSLMVISLILDGIKHGRRQIKKTDPNYPQVVQPIFLGLMISTYLGLLIKFFTGALDMSELGIPRGSIIIYLFVFILFCMGLIFFPLIIASMVSFIFYIPYFGGYQFGKNYWAKERRLQPDEMIEFLKQLRVEKSLDIFKFNEFYN